MDIKQAIKNAITDIKVELTDEFVQNFVRKGFFNTKWPDVKRDPGVGSLMNRTGSLMRSIEATIEDNTIVFTSSMPYADIHNSGGPVKTNVPVTDKMRKWAWAIYYKTKNNKYKAMALTKKTHFSATFDMPQRQFIGAAPQVKSIVEENIKRNIDEFFNDFNKNFKR
jgi:phage gpG-like protein